MPGTDVVSSIVVPSTPSMKVVMMPAGDPVRPGQVPFGPAEAVEAQRRRDGGPVFWVRCSGCGAVVTTTEKMLDSGKVHEDWRKLSEDCLTEQARQVMET